MGQPFFCVALILNWKWMGTRKKSIIAVYFDLLASAGYILICLHLSYSCA
jgi:hypothetical protein